MASLIPTPEATQQANVAPATNGVGSTIPNTPAATTTPTTTIPTGGGFPSSTPPATGAITSSSITPQAPITPIQPNTPPVPSVPLAPVTPALTETPSQSKESDLSTQIAALNTSLEGRSAAQTAAEAAQGLPALNQTVKDLTARATALSDQANQIPLIDQNNAAGRGITAGGLAPLDSANLRNNAIEALSVHSLLAAAQGNVTYAQSLADKAVAAQFDPITEKLTALTANLNLIKNDPQTTIEEKNQAQAQLDNVAQQQAQIDQQKADATAVQKVAVSAAQNIKTFKATSDYPTASQAIQAIQSAKTEADATAIATKTGLITATNDYQFVPATANQTSGYFDKTTGKFVPNAGSPTPGGNQGTVTTVGGNGVLIGGIKIAPTIANDVQAVLEGRNTLYNIRQTMGRSNTAAAYMKSVRDAITSVDPQFDFIASDAGGKSVSTSYVQKATAAINSVLPNINNIINYSNQVPRIGVTGVDALLQKGNLVINNQKVSNFHEAQKLIADEIGVALGAGTVSDMKLQLGFDVTDPSVSQEVFASNMGVVKSFLENRLSGIQSLRYSSSTAGGSDTNQPQVIPTDQIPAGYYQASDGLLYKK